MKRSSNKPATDDGAAGEVVAEEKRTYGDSVCTAKKATRWLLRRQRLA